MNALVLELFGSPQALPDLPVMKSIRGVGTSDNPGCAAILETRFDYRNTFYHQEPRLDVSKPPPETGTCDFVICSDVLEHVSPPVGPSFSNLRALLKPHGFLAMTVPYSLEESTREHFPEIHEFSLVTAGERLALVNRTRGGEWQVFDNLVFHGGRGATLEMRLFSERDLRRHLADAGFSRVEFAVEEYPPFGIVHRGPWGLPLIAGNDPFRLSRAAVTELIERYAGLQAECAERTDWALQLDREAKVQSAEMARLAEELNSARFRNASWEASRWIHLGRALGLGPKVR